MEPIQRFNRNLVVVAVMFFYMCANAQTLRSEGFSFLSSLDSRLEFVQEENTDSSTLIYMAYTTSDSDDWAENEQLFCIDEKMYLKVPGREKQYCMLSTVNMPVFSEAVNRYFMFERPNQRHQFVLEFERIPDGCPFIMTEGNGELHSFHFDGINGAQEDSTKHISIEQFVEGFPVREFGQFAMEGKIVSYMKYKDIVVSVLPELLKQYGKYFNINVCVSNFSNKSVLFKPENISARAFVFKNDTIRNYYIEEVSLNPLTYEEFDKIIKKKQNWESFFVGLGGMVSAICAGMSTTTSTATYIGDSYGYSRGYVPTYTTSFGVVTLTTYDASNAYLVNQKISADMVAHEDSQEQIRKQLRDGYVKLHTIPSGSSYSGFFNIKYKRKLERILLTFVIDGEEYTFQIYE